MSKDLPIIKIFDTTLRDGEQSPGATMNLQEKVRLALQLESLGVDVIEAGFPISSIGDFEAVQAISKALTTTEVAGLARCVTKDIERTWEAIKEAKKPRIHTFLASSPIHMEYKLRKSPEEVVKMAVEGVKCAASFTKNVEFSAEDASRSDKDFLVELFTAVIDAGATTINIPDTVGYATPENYGEFIKYIIDNTKNSEKAVFSAHCHNDLGLAVANTLAAIKAGARQVEVTLCGIGERAGNAALEEVVMAMKTRQDIYPYETNIVSEQLFPSCRLLSMIIGRPVGANKAIVGANAFAHESGVHQDGMLKNRETYEIMTPQSIGRTTSELVIGKHSGRNAINSKLESLGYNFEEKELETIYEAIKALADKKKKIHDEDIEALVMGEIYRVPDSYKLVSLSVQSGTGELPATAAIALQIDDKIHKHAGFGAGPVDAALNVISHLVGRAPTLERFAVNAITDGTDAQGEVTVNITEQGLATVGKGTDPDIIVASARAYIDALNRLTKKEKDTTKE